jgi:hypothetical protein
MMTTTTLMTALLGLNILQLGSPDFAQVLRAILM